MVLKIFSHWEGLNTKHTVGHTDKQELSEELVSNGNLFVMLDCIGEAGW